MTSLFEQLQKEYKEQLELLNKKMNKGSFEMAKDICKTYEYNFLKDYEIKLSEYSRINKKTLQESVIELIGKGTLLDEIFYRAAYYELTNNNNDTTTD